MAINLKFDSVGNPEPPTIILSNRNGNKLGQLDVNAESIDLSDKFNDASEFTFTLNKYVDGKITNLWDKVVDFKLVYCKEWNTWFEIKVELDEATETVKTVFCTQLGQAELSQIMLFNIEINTEEDIERDDYKITILYDEDDPEASMLHRILEKAPHYSIVHVDPTIARIQRSFSFDGTSIKDAFDEIGEEIGCLFVYNSDSDENGMPRRTISVYDLQQNCNDCGHRGEFTDICPNLECGSTNIKYGYGEDTLIFVTADELATEGIQLVTDTDSVKNCFKLEAGDDLMTAAVRSCNPNGSDYIWYFSDSIKEDMSEELVKKIEEYNNEYKRYYNEHVSNLDVNLLNKYNALVEKYKGYYNTPSTCLNCNYEGEFYDVCPKCSSDNVLYGKSLQPIATPITGYSSLINAYYNTIDLAWYLKSGLMPSIEMSETNAAEQVALLTSSSLSPVAVEKIDIASRSTANSAVLSMAKVIVKSTYKVEIENPDKTDWIDNGDGTKTWKGKFIVTNYSDDEDTATGNFVSVRVNGDKETFIKQKIEKSLNKEDTDDYSISGLFAKDYDDFCDELKKYALTPLTNFYDACESCVSILIAQKVGEDKSSDLYQKLYAPYRDKQRAIEAEIKVRESEVNLITGVYNAEGNLTIEGLQTNIEDCKKQIQDKLNFESCLGEKLWLEFCSYRREDKYSNENYISDGLNNAELFKKALEFIEVAENEIYKSAELQHSISATLNNLLAIPKFKPLVKSFKTGNWIRVQINDEIYKLRLLEYDINYNDFENISVEFSDVTKVKNGITDVEDVLSQASSMSSSYDSVQRQAKKGSAAQGAIEQWLSNGLNSANVKIKSNTNEEILITKNGLLARTKSDITGEYSPAQFKLTHNIMAYTTDGWDTVSTALGEHDYSYWDGEKFVKGEDYGLSTKFVTAGHVIGSQIISGEIISNNYESGTGGTYFNLRTGDFELAGGKIVFNSSDNVLALSDVTIEWDSTNSPEIKNVSGLTDALERIDIDIEKARDDADKQIDDLQDYVDKQDTSLSDTLTSAYENYTNSQISILDDAVSNYFGLGGGTIIGKDYVISPCIEGGYLHIAGDKCRVIVDPNHLIPNNENVFMVFNKDLEKMVMGVDGEGNAVFSGTIEGSEIIGENHLLIGDKTKEGDYAEITKEGHLICTDVEIKGGTLTIGNERDENGNLIAHTWISDKGVLNTYESHIQGTITASEIQGSTIIGKSTLYVGEYIDEETGKPSWLSWIDEDGVLHARGAHVEELTAVDGIFNDCTITGGSLKIGNDETGYSAWISSEDGRLHAQGAYIDGEVTAIKGYIGGWELTEKGVRKEGTVLDDGTIINSATVLNSNDTWTMGTLKPYDENDPNWYHKSPVRFYCGVNGDAGFVALADGSVYADYVFLRGGIIGGWTINENSIEKDGTILNADDNNTYYSLVSIGETSPSRFSCGDGNFRVLDDGSVYANHIQIDGGTIGNFEIDGDGYFKCYNKDNDVGNSMQLSELGLSIITNEIDGIDISGDGVTMNNLSYGSDYVSWYDIIAVCKNGSNNSSGNNGGNNEVSSNAAELSSKVSELSTEFKTFRDDDFKELKTKVGTIDTDVSDLKGKVALFEEQIPNIESSVSDLESGISDLESGISGLESRISGLEDSISSLSESLDAHVSDDGAHAGCTCTDYGSDISALWEAIDGLSAAIDALGSEENT